MRFEAETQPLNNKQDLKELLSERVLITGGKGSLGIRLGALLREHGINFLSTDKDSLDILSRTQIKRALTEFSPSLIVHLAADKHAPAGEEHPKETLEINALGVANLLDCLNSVKSKSSPLRIILASTCKACDPETVYGATKLIAERMTLREGHSVARFYNVVETSGNVFSLWNSLAPNAPIPVMNCYRYFISIDAAVSLIVRTMARSRTYPGRYTINPGASWPIPDLARKVFPGRRLILVKPRKGDREREPLKAVSEKIVFMEDDFWRIESPHDL